MMTKNGSTKIVNFMTSRTRFFCAGVCHYKSFSENAFYINKPYSPLQGIGRQIENGNFVTMNKIGSTNIVNFMTPAAAVFVIGHGHISQILKKTYF